MGGWDMVDGLNGKVVDMGQKNLRDEIAIEVMKWYMNSPWFEPDKDASPFCYRLADQMMKERSKNG
jgi:hypothetical protein